MDSDSSLIWFIGWVLTWQKVQRTAHALSICPNPSFCSCPPAMETFVCLDPMDPQHCTWTTPLWELTSRTLSIGSNLLSGANEGQQFQTDQWSLVDDLVFPFPLDYVVSRHLATTARQKGSVYLGAGQSPLDPVDQQSHTHGYNTGSKSKVKNVTQVGDL